MAKATNATKKARLTFVDATAPVESGEVEVADGRLTVPTFPLVTTLVNMVLASILVAMALAFWLLSNKAVDEQAPQVSLTVTPIKPENGVGKQGSIEEITVLDMGTQETVERAVPITVTVTVLTPPVQGVDASL
jgi:hypothetical protein